MSLRTFDFSILYTFDPSPGYSDCKIYTELIDHNLQMWI